MGGGFIGGSVIPAGIEFIKGKILRTVFYGMVQTEHSDGSRDWEQLNIEKLLLDDCIPHIEKHYRVASDKWRRAMAGSSMGSMQTSITTLKHPELFGYAGIFSGFLGMIGDLSKKENSHFAAFEDKAKLFESYKLFFRSLVFK